MSPDRRLGGEHNVWTDGDEVIVDFFGAYPPDRPIRHEDALAGIVMDRRHACWLIANIAEALSWG